MDRASVTSQIERIGSLLPELASRWRTAVDYALVILLDELS